MAPYSATTQRACTQILTRARLVATPLVSKRHQSTFSFFSRSQDNFPAHIQTSNTQLHQSPTKPSSLVNANALKTSPSFANAAPLLAAIQNKDQDTAWMVYSVLSRADQLTSLLPMHHSLLLRSIRPVNPGRFTSIEVAKLTERFEQVWAGMLQCQIQPDMNDFTTRLKFFVATWQHKLVDKTWTQMREMSGSAAKNAPRTSSTPGNAPLIQPTLYTYNLVLQSCVRGKDINLAMETMTLMRRAGIKPDNMSWDYILQIHTAMKNWAAVESTFRSAFITTGVTESAHPRAQQSGQHGALRRSIVIPLGQRARSLHGGALTPHNRHGNNQDKLVPSIQNIHTLFSYYAYTQDLEEMRSMFDSHVRLFGLVPTTRTYNEMMKFAFLAGRDRDGLNLFKELVQIGQNVAKMQQNQGHGDRIVSRDDADARSGSDIQQQADLAGQASPSSPPIPVQLCGPNFDTFKILINNEFIARRNRWGRALKWIHIMQQEYGILPNDTMFRRILKGMERRGGDEATMQALQDNWDRVRALKAERSN